MGAAGAKMGKILLTQGALLAGKTIKFFAMMRYESDFFFENSSTALKNSGVMQSML